MSEPTRPVGMPLGETRWFGTGSCGKRVYEVYTQQEGAEEVED